MITHARTHAWSYSARTHARTHGVTPHPRTHARMELLRTHARTHAWSYSAHTHARTQAWNVVRFILPFKYVYIVPKFHSAIMAHRVHVFSRELNAINDVKHDKQKCNRIIDKRGMELVHCICDCVFNVLQGNIPLKDDEKERLKRHRHCLRKLVNKKTSY